MIDWTALMQVCIATVGATVLVVGIFAIASSAMSQAQEEEEGDRGALATSGASPTGHTTALRAIGYGGFALAGLFVLYGIYLIVPYLHG